MNEYSTQDVFEAISFAVVQDIYIWKLKNVS